MSTETASTDRPKYPRGVPNKFTPDGKVQRFPGNTTVCHIPQNSPILSGLQEVYNALSTHPTLSKLMAMLPPSSWHMTTLEGVREIDCDPNVKTLDEYTQEFSRSLRKLGLEFEQDGLAPPYQMRFRRFDPAAQVGVGLQVEGATVEEEKRMRRLRDRLADEGLGFRMPDHETYIFHISISYFLRHIEGQDRVDLNELLAKQVPEIHPEFELGAVEFCTFEDMFAFPRVFYLGEKEGE